MNKWVLEHIKPELSLGAKKNDKTEASYFGHIIRRQDSLENTIMLGKVEGSRKRRPNMRWIDSIKEAIGMSLEELSRAVEDRTLWAALIRQVVRSQN